MTLFDKVAFNWTHLCQQNNPFRSFIAYLLSKLHISHFIRYKRNGSILQMRSAGLARSLWEDPNLVLDGELFFSTAIRPGDIVVDVGANIGVLSLLASKLTGPSGLILAIEAHPRTFYALLKNLKNNNADNVKPLRTAVGLEPGVIRFTDRLDDDWNKVDNNSGSLEVKIQPLDDVCVSYPRINVLKIDVEGFELHVLKGSSNVLTRTYCVLLECWAEHTRNFGYLPEDLITFMKSACFFGYRLSETKGKISLVPLGDVSRSDNLENWVFVRQSAWLSQRCNISFLHLHHF